MTVIPTYIKLMDADGGVRTLEFNKEALDKIKLPVPDLPLGPGDDDSPPNAVKAKDVNGIASYLGANVGFSNAKQKNGYYPSSMEHNITVKEGDNGGYALELELVMEYVNPHPGQSMMIAMKKMQQEVAHGQSLKLIETRFQDFVQNKQGEGHFVDIVTNIRFTEEAEAVQQAVVQSASSQTAGTAKTLQGMDEAKLGPVGEKGRIIMTYLCEGLYSYAEMAMEPGEATSNYLVPLAVFLPYSPYQTLEGGLMSCSVSLSVPPQASILDAEKNILAYHHLKNQEPFSGCLVISSSALNPNTNKFRAVYPCLPQKPWCHLFWLRMPQEPADFGFEIIENEKMAVDGEDGPGVVNLLEPQEEDLPSLKMSLPGNGPKGSLRRLVLETRAVPGRDDQVRVLTNFTISDASGSTSMRVDNEQMRSLFNKMEIRRTLLRLKYLPTLVEKGVLGLEDRWVEVALIFDHTLKETMSLHFKIGDLVKEAGAIEALIKAEEEGSLTAFAAAHKFWVLNKVCDFISKIENVQPSGATSFSEPAKAAYGEMLKVHKLIEEELGPDFDTSRLLLTSFVNWDTDGGHNASSLQECYDQICQFVSSCNVMGGVVNGVGSWLDQHCASKVAKLLKGSCVLSLSLPEVGSEGMDNIFRQNTNAWLKFLRAVPMRVTLSAGAITWNARQDERSENGLEVIAAKNDSPDATTSMAFDLPDVTSEDYTGAVVKNVVCGEKLMFYVISRHDSDESLLRDLCVTVNGRVAQVARAKERDHGIPLVYQWMTCVQKTNLSNDSSAWKMNKSFASARVLDRCEEDLSFNSNIPSISGSTAYLGRKKTMKRPPIDLNHQPEDPSLELVETTEIFNHYMPQMRFFGGAAMAPQAYSSGPKVAMCASMPSSLPSPSYGMRPGLMSKRLLAMPMSTARMRAPQHEAMEAEAAPGGPGPIHWLKILQGTNNLMAGTKEHIKKSLQSLDPCDALEGAEKDMEGLSKTYGQYDEDPLLSDILGSKTSSSLACPRSPGDPNDPRDRLANFVTVCTVLWALLRRTPVGVVERRPSEEEIIVKFRGLEQDPKVLAGAARKLLRELKASGEGDMQRLKG